MKVLYEFSRGSHLPHRKATFVARYLVAAQRKMKKKLTPHDIVAIAQPVRNPLHPYFDWDDDSAGAKYRLWQARYLLSQIRVTFINGAPQGPVHLFINLSTVEEEGEGKDRGYVMVMDAMKDPILRRQVLERALAEAAAWRAKYQMLNELGEIFVALDRVKIKQLEEVVG